MFEKYFCSVRIWSTPATTILSCQSWRTSPERFPLVERSWKRIRSVLFCLKQPVNLVLVYSHSLNWSDQYAVQSNLWTTTTLETLNLWLLLTGGRCSEVVYVIKSENGVANGSLCRQVVVGSGLIVLVNFVDFERMVENSICTNLNNVNKLFNVG